MVPELLKEKMKELWKNTFHDSDAYISLIFDNYFNPENIEYYEENGKLISALLGIPYSFGNGKEKIEGIYLCGLATINEFRQRGIMSKLISKFNEKIENRGYAFSFLIPASDMLRIYYSSRGFENAMYVVEDRYTEVHNFANDYKSTLNKEDQRVRLIKIKHYDNLTTEILSDDNEKEIDKVVEYIIKSENSDNNYSTLLHDDKDCRIMIKENNISGGRIIISKNNDNAITGVLFATFDERKRIIIPKIYHNDNCTYFKLLDRIKSLFPDSSMSVFCFPEETERRVLWSKVYGAANPDGAPGGAYGVAERVYDVNRHAKPYGMVKILDYREILKFIAKDRSDCKYSILVKDGIQEKIALYAEVKDGTATIKEVSDDEFAIMKKNPNLTVLTKRDFAEIIFRKKDSNSLIMEALGIPRLSLNMALLLD